MKILIVSDHESKKIWDFYEPGMLSSYDLILSCGDLSPHYLQFLATMSRAEVLYVHGNHDGCYEATPPEGCFSVEDRIYDFYGLRILGLGGSMRYKEGPCMYTEKEMRHRIRKLSLKLRRSKGFDILLAHAPAYGINDSKDLPHTGFRCFLTLLDRFEPRYLIHGHVHKTYGSDFRREDTRGATRIINAYETYVLELPDEDFPRFQNRESPKEIIRKKLQSRRFREKKDWDIPAV